MLCGNFFILRKRQGCYRVKDILLGRKALQPEIRQIQNRYASASHTKID